MRRQVPVLMQTAVLGRTGGQWHQLDGEFAHRGGASASREPDQLVDQMGPPSRTGAECGVDLLEEEDGGAAVEGSADETEGQERAVVLGGQEGHRVWWLGGSRDASIVDSAGDLLPGK